MKSKLVKAVVLLCILGVLGGLCLDSAYAKDQITIVIVGDSTAATYNPARAPLQGWGAYLGAYFKDTVVVKNYAAPTRSSKSYIEEGFFDQALNELGAGDYLFIQFGQYDGVKDDPKRYTEPFGSFKEYLAKYVEAARAKSAYPVLITPVERWSFNKDGTINPTHGDYPDAIREVSWEMRVPLIDLTAKTQLYWEYQGPYDTQSMFMYVPPNIYSAYPNGVSDSSLLREYGAQVVADMIVGWIRETAHPLARHLSWL